MPKILDRLVRQLRARGVKNPYPVAKGVLTRHGIMKKGSMSLTAKGKKRNAMSPAERAKARSAKYSGKKASDFKYNRKTNRATLK